MALAFEQFVKQLEESGVVPSGKLATFLPPNAHPKDAQDLARQLVQSKHLTKYQAQEIYAGRSRGLSLGNYTIIDTIGAGGMGQVFKAEHRRMKRVVALKTLPSSITKDPAAVARFQREVEAAARLRHTNIVAADDADEANGVHFLVMEFVDGKDLSAIVKEHGPLPVAQAVECTRQAALGLAYAHKRGVIHRDIKPANLLLDSEGTVKILDMGLARLEGQLQDAASMAGLTQSGQVMGTVDYMSPEQAEETRGVDARADQYSLGCTLWVLLTGRPMFGGTTTIAKLMAHRTAPIPSLRGARADLPEAVEAVFRKMVAKEPDERYASMDEVIAALATCLGEAAPATLDGPSSSDSRLTEFFQQIAGTKTAAPPKSVTAVDGETQQLQPAKQETGTEHKIASPVARSEATQPVAPDAKAPPTKTVVPLAAFAEKTAEKKVGRAHPTPAKRKLHPLALATLIAIVGLGSMGLLLGSLLLFVLPHEQAVPEISSPTPDDMHTTDAAHVRVASGLHFDGEDDFVEIPSLQFDGDPPLTIEAWLEPDEGDNNHRWAVMLGDSKRQFFGLKLFDNQWQALLGDGATQKWTTAVSDRDAQQNQREHVAATWDGRQVRLYVNGQPFSLGERSLDVTTVRPRGALLIGRAKGLKGTIDEVRVSRFVVYSGQFVPPAKFSVERDTLALYLFDQGQGDVLRDSSGNNHHGKIVGAKWVRIDQPTSASDNALEFRNYADRVEVPLPDSAELNEAITVDAWLEVDDQINAHFHWIFSVDTPRRVGLSVAQGADQKWRIAADRLTGIEPPASVQTARTSFSHIPRKLRHVAVVFDPSRVEKGWTQLELFVDGRSFADSGSYQLPKAIETIAQRLIIGNNEASTAAISGRIAELRVSRVARYSSESLPDLSIRHFTPDADTFALYHFDEGAGDVLRDSSGNNHHGKIVGAKWVKAAGIPTSPANGLHFDGVDDVVKVPSLVYDGSYPVTMEAWLTLDKDQALAHALVLGDLAGNKLQLKRGGRPRWEFIAPAAPPKGYIEVSSPTHTVEVGRRDHVAGTWDGKNLQLFVNGKRIAVNDIGHGEPVLPRGPLQIGFDETVARGWKHPFAGTIDEVRISKGVRYEIDFQPLPTLAADPETLALYHFDEGQGDVLRDSSGNGHHGNITGEVGAVGHFRAA